MLRRKNGCSVSPAQDDSKKTSTTSRKCLSSDGRQHHTIASGGVVGVGSLLHACWKINRLKQQLPVLLLVGTLLCCSISWLFFFRSNHNSSLIPRRVFSKWDGTVVDLMPSLQQYFQVTALQGNFTAFQRVYIVQEDSLFISDLVPKNQDDRMVAERAKITEPVLLKLASERKLRDGSVFLVNYQDSHLCLDETLFIDTNGEPVHKVPILTLSRPTQCDYAFPMVTYETIRFVATRTKSMETMENPPPWLSRDKRVVWRGSPTGIVRIDLGSFVANHTDLLDYQLTFFLITGKKGKEFLGPNDLQRYRAVLDLDGASWSSRFGSLLCSASVVLKYDPKNVDYFHSELKPFVHYIPVTDSKDLLEKARFIQDDENAGAIQDIIRNANTWCNKRLKQSEIELDMASILLDYSSYVAKIDTAKLMSTHRFTKVLSQSELSLR